MTDSDKDRLMRSSCIAASSEFKDMKLRAWCHWDCKTKLQLAMFPTVCWDMINQIVWSTYTCLRTSHHLVNTQFSVSLQYTHLLTASHDHILLFL